MKDVVDRIMGATNNVFRAILFLSMCFVGAVAFAVTLEYVVNKTRSTDHWVKYYNVRPSDLVFDVGEQPVLISQSDWRYAVLAAWPDIMWCMDIEGPQKGLLIAYRLKFETGGELRKPGKSGFYDEDGSITDGSTSGRWSWSGTLPQYESDCHVEPKPVLYPSPGVVRHVELPPTKQFFFRRS